MIEFLDKSMLVPQKKDFLETSRYLGYSKTNVTEIELIEECCLKLFSDIIPSVVYEKMDLNIVNDENTICFSNFKITSKNLLKNLQGCKWVYLLAATIGSKTDFIIRKNELENPVNAAIFHAAGAMFIEKTVNLVNKKICDNEECNGNICKPRFSPGFGDLNLEVQEIFFKILPCSKIGLSLMDSLIMAPEKSVTAFIGVKPIN